MRVPRPRRQREGKADVVGGCGRQARSQREDDRRSPLYGVDRLAALPPRTPVVVVEGERAADALNAAGIAAVGTVTGASGTPSVGALLALGDYDIYLWSDNDKAGLGHMNRIAARLAENDIAEPKLIEWKDAPEKGDAADFFEAGGAAEGVRELMTVADPYRIDTEREWDLAETLAPSRAIPCGTTWRFTSVYQSVACTLWVVHTHAVDQAETSPYLGIESAEKRSGKSRLLDCLDLLTACPWRAVLPSDAVVYRKIATGDVTLLLDEIDAVFGPKSASQHEGLRGLLNAGTRRGTTVPRVVGEGGKMRVEEFPVFCPKAIAGIGKLPDTVADRSIPIRLRRRKRSESVARFRYREAKAQAAPIREAVAGHAERLDVADARPAIPDALNDRAADGWEPLLAIATRPVGIGPKSADGGRCPQRRRGRRRRLSRGAASWRYQRHLCRAEDERIWTEDLLSDLPRRRRAPVGRLSGPADQCGHGGAIAWPVRREAKAGAHPRTGEARLHRGRLR